MEMEDGALIGRTPRRRGSRGVMLCDNHSMPESLSAFCSIVSLTAAKTSRIFEVSVACVRLGDGLGTREKKSKESGQAILTEDRGSGVRGSPG